MDGEKRAPQEGSDTPSTKYLSALNSEGSRSLRVGWKLLVGPLRLTHPTP